MINFIGRHFQQEMILQCVRWYLAYSLSYRDIEKIMKERELEVDHSTIQRWVVHYAPKLERTLVITAAQVNHVPIIAHYARRLGLVELVNRLVPVEMEVEPGLIVLGLVLDTLSGRSPLVSSRDGLRSL
jgi:hypothetical protein